MDKIFLSKKAIILYDRNILTQIWISGIKS